MRGKTKEEYHKRSVALAQVRRSLLRRGTCDLRAQYVRRNRLSTISISLPSRIDTLLADTGPSCYKFATTAIQAWSAHRYLVFSSRWSSLSLSLGLRHQMLLVPSADLRPSFAMRPLPAILFVSAMAAAGFTPTAPGPGEIYQAGSACTIKWGVDTTGGTWTNVSIRRSSLLHY